MKIDFLRPWWLVAIPLILAFLWIVANTGKNSFRKKLICYIRSIICILLVLAMSGIGIKTYTDITTTIFAADLSASMDEAERKIEDYIKEAVRHKTEKDYAGIVAFGKNAAVEITPAKEIVVSGFNSYMEKDGTDIEKALKTASLIINENSEKRIVLISDGNETISSVLKYAPVLNASGIKVDGVYMENTLEREVQITDIDTPNVMDKNTEFDVEVIIHSLTDTKANVKVFKGNEIAVNREVNLSKGENRFMFTDVSQTGGGIIYRAEISSEHDTLSQNNKAYAYTYVEDVPSVLIVQNKDNSGNEISKLLEKSNVKVKLVSEERVPTNLEQLNLWDCVVMADVSTEGLSKDFLTALESFVKTTGGGLVVLGGENSFALGGYQNTILNDMLPVSTELETEGEKPDLGMVMVIDRSGSMTDSSYGISRMEMAKEAAMRAVEIMEPTDSIGVIAFDDQPAWAVEMQKTEENSQTISRAIGEIQPGGGTSILPALTEAYNKLKTADTKLKHIILLTDGQAEQTGYDMLIENMKQNGITLSTVAVGSGADTKLLKSLAEKGNGRYYFTNEFTDLPQIFTKETTLAGKEYINNRTFYPEARDQSVILKGAEAVPSLDGYISSTAKPRADVVLQSDKKEPILASWQYGIGRTVAWTSDSSGKWTGNWLGSDEGTLILRNMVSWTIRGGISNEISFSGEKNGDKTLIKAEMPYDGNIKTVSATILSSDSKETSVKMESKAPGIYSAEVEDMKEGGYIINLSMMMSNGETKIGRGGFVIKYPKEYDLRSFSKGSETMQKIVEATGGRMIADPKEVFENVEKTALKSKEISALLLILAVILFVFEIAVRRIGILIDKLERMFKRYSIKKKVSLKRNTKTVSEKRDIKTVSKERIDEKNKMKEEADIKIEEPKVTTASALVMKKKNRR